MSYIVPIGPYHPALEEPVHAVGAVLAGVPGLLQCLQQELRGAAVVFDQQYLHRFFPSISKAPQHPPGSTSRPSLPQRST